MVVMLFILIAFSMSITFLIGIRGFVSVWVSKENYLLSYITIVLFTSTLFLNILYYPLVALINADGLFKDNKKKDIYALIVYSVVLMLPTVVINSDSDGDGVPDKLDQCPATPFNVIVDDRGCPFTMPGVGLKMEYRAFFDKDSSELLPKYQAELDKVGMRLQEYKTATILIEGHNSRTEVDSASINEANALAQDRANKVKNYLNTYGYAQYYPAYPLVMASDGGVNNVTLFKVS